MKHIKFEENILVDDSYNVGVRDVNADDKKGKGIAKHFAENLEYDEIKKWYHQIPAEPPITKTLSDDKVAELKKEASSAVHGDTLAYENKSSKNSKSDHQWARTLMNKGAIGDRVAAATILIQDNPLYNLTAVRNLIGLVKPAKKKDGLKVIDALSELMIADLLVPNVKLTKFEQHALGHLDELTSGNKDTRKKILKLWYFEDQLKDLYETYVEALNKFAHDSVDSNREKAVSSMSYLLMHHPEKEKMLLINVINKLGDPSQGVASKVIYHLSQLLYNHPNMKPVVLAEIEKMLFRANISKRAQYYGICFLNQFFLGKDDSKVAEQLISVYFSFFKACIKTGSIDSRLMSAILTGVKRAWPFAANERQMDNASVHIDAVHKLVHLAQLNVAVHALALLAQMSGGNDDRFYTALYRKLSDPSIFETAHTAMLFSLIYKCMKRDTNVERISAFLKRLLQICTMVRPAQACGILFMISQILKDSKKSEAIRLSWDAVKDEIKEEDEIQTPNDSVESIKEEDNQENKEETKKLNPKIDLLKGDKIDLLTEENDEEIYQDLKIDSKGKIRPKRRPNKDSDVTSAGWFHVRIKPETSETVSEMDAKMVNVQVKDRIVEDKIQMKRTMNISKVITSYDPHARNPSFAGAQHSIFSELYVMMKYFHPTVKLFAQKLMNRQIINYTGDPLIDFSGARFLDRFVFKNPKKIDKHAQNEEENGVRKIKGSHPKFAVRDNYIAKGLKNMPVTSSTYINEDPSRIPVDERFLYDFLQRRRTANEAIDSDGESDNDSVTSEDFEKYLDQVTGAKKGSESDEELDFLAEVEASTATSKKSKSVTDDATALSEDEEGESDGDVDVSGDGDVDISDDEGSDVSGDQDELLLEDSDDDDQYEGPSSKKFKTKGSGDLNSLFASAEEFSTILEDTAQTKNQGSSQAVSTSDNADVKQLAWEENRDKWVKGFNRKVLGGKGKPRGKKRFNGDSKRGGKKFDFQKTDRKKGGKFENRKRTGGHFGNVGGKKKKMA